MTYRVELLPRARRDLKKIADPTLSRIRAALHKLETDPRPPGCKKLEDSDEWRIRVGDYRVIYDIYDDRLVVSVVTVDDRKDVYRKR